MWEEIEQIVSAIDAEAGRTKVSKEKTMAGKLLYSPPALNTAFKMEFEKREWREAKQSYYSTDDPELIRRTLGLSPKDQQALLKAEGKVPIGSKTQTDFVRERVAIEVQFGKYTFIPYDLFLKHMAFFVANEIDLGVELVPMKVMQAEMSSGPGYYENALHQIVRQGRGVPAVPLVLVGVQPDAPPNLEDLPEGALLEDEEEADAEGDEQVDSGSEA